MVDLTIDDVIEMIDSITDPKVQLRFAITSGAMYPLHLSAMDNGKTLNEYGGNNKSNRKRNRKNRWL
jgi:hypothetical protein